MKNQFEIAMGTITGSSHLAPLLWRNNQDAISVLMSDDAIIAVVADGCSSSVHSEAGAQIFSNMLTRKIRTALVQASQTMACEGDEIFFQAILAEVKDDLLAEMRILAHGMGDNFRRVINDYFLFTLAGAIITKGLTCVFSLGDAVFFINDEKITSGPYPENKPPYLAYGLIPTEIPAELVKFQILGIKPTNEVQHLLLGTDGAQDLISGADKNLPGTNQKLGGIDQFWFQDRYFKNPDIVRRRLALANKATNDESALLPDDTTIIIVRRKKGGEANDASNSGEKR